MAITMVWVLVAMFGIGGVSTLYENNIGSKSAICNCQGKKE